MKSQIRALLERITGASPRTLDVQIRPLLGGLVSASVCAVSARYGDGSGATETKHWVVKHLQGRACREARIYQALRRTGAIQLAPSVIAVERAGGGQLQLYLEQVVPKHPWPWRDTSAAGNVLRALAQLHDSAGKAFRASVSDWDYDTELQQLAEQLLQAVDQRRGLLEGAGMAVRLAVIRRLTERLPEWRRELLMYRPLAQSLIHGDAHPGNVMITRRNSSEVPILFDWERARLGSPLEDVSSWLQTLAFWEPEVRRRHDTLLGDYLCARGLNAQPTRPLRDMYWLAAACNCLSGSLLYHLSVGTSPDAAAPSRAAALRAVRDQLRILRRADACWS